MNHLINRKSAVKGLKKGIIKLTSSYSSPTFHVVIKSDRKMFSQAEVVDCKGCAFLFRADIYRHNKNQYNVLIEIQ